MFKDKLNFIMNLTSTKNSALGRALNYDASYISRIRSGARGIPKDQSFTESAAAYFACKIQTECQREILSHIICPESPWPDSRKEAEALILHWMRAQTGFTPPTLAAIGEEHQDFAASPARFYYGNNGKREAVISFLSEICSDGKQHIISCCSDSQMDWMTENKISLLQCLRLGRRFLDIGGKIRIIHTVTRNLSEMQSGLDMWLPLYMRGAIEAYYYPNQRDGVFHRTLLVAPGRCAVVSSDTGPSPEKWLCTFIRDPNAVQALETEYESYLKQCRPLIIPLWSLNQEELSSTLEAHESAPAKWVITGAALSAMTMPAGLIASLQERGYPAAPHYLRSAERFSALLKAGVSVVEKLRLPNPQLVREGRIPLPFCDFCEEAEAFYTPEEFRLHLLHIRELTAADTGYSAVLTSSVPKDAFCSIKENVSCILRSTDASGIAYYTDEPQLSAALWSRFSCDREPVMNRKKWLSNLDAYLAKL